MTNSTWRTAITRLQSEVNLRQNPL